MGAIINTAAGHTPTPVLRGVFCQILSPPELMVARTRENTVRLPPNPTHKKASEKPKGFKDRTRASCLSFTNSHAMWAEGAGLERFGAGTAVPSSSRGPVSCLHSTCSTETSVVRATHKGGVERYRSGHCQSQTPLPRLSQGAAHSWGSACRF